MNINTDRWIVSSVTKHFADLASGTVDFMTEDADVDTSRWSSWVELRLNGPEFKEGTKDHWIINLEVDLLITAHMTKTNIYWIHELAGIFQAGCKHIPIYKYGDDNSLAFCISLDTDLAHPIRKVNFGRPSGSRFKRVSVMAFYEHVTTL